MTEEERLNEERRAVRLAELERLPAIGFESLHAIVDKWLILPDRGAVKFLLASYIANRLPGHAVWTFLVGPSGAGKTELLNCLLDLPEIFPLSSLTANTFISGMPNKQASLLPKLKGKILIFKDWTTMLSLQREAQQEIMAQLREIWDGQVRKAFGTGKTFEWEGKVGLIAGSTQVVDMAQQQNAKLGERFIFYRLILPDRKEVARKVIKNSKDEVKMSKELKDAFFAFFKSLDLDTELPADDPDYLEELIRLTDFMTQARSSVIRDFGFKKEVIFVPAAEMPTRVTNQLNALSRAMMLMNGGPLTPDDKRIIYKAALDSIPGTNKMVLCQVARRQNQSTSEIATALGYPSSTIHTYLENMSMLQVIRRHRGADTEEGGTADRWSMPDDFVKILRTYEAVPNETPEPKEIEPSPVGQELIGLFGGEQVE